MSYMKAKYEEAMENPENIFDPVVENGRISEKSSMLFDILNTISDEVDRLRDILEGPVPSSAEKRAEPQSLIQNIDMNLGLAIDIDYRLTKLINKI